MIQIFETPQAPVVKNAEAGDLLFWFSKLYGTHIWSLKNQVWMLWKPGSKVGEIANG